MRDTYEIRLGSQGRLVIPAELRDVMAAEEGAIYVAHIDDSGALVMRTHEQALLELQRIWAENDLGRGGESATDELIAERRVQAAAE